MRETREGPGEAGAPGQGSRTTVRGERVGEGGWEVSPGRGRAVSCTGGFWGTVAAGSCQACSCAHHSGGASERQKGNLLLTRESLDPFGTGPFWRN